MGRLDAGRGEDQPRLLASGQSPDALQRERAREAEPPEELPRLLLGAGAAAAQDVRHWSAFERPGELLHVVLRGRMGG